MNALKWIAAWVRRCIVVFLLPARVGRLEMIARIREIRETGELPAELAGADNPETDPNQAPRYYRAAARRLANEALEAALAPRPEDASQAKLREQVLELARKWFTRAMKLRVKPLGLHMLDDPTYRL